MVLGGRVEGGTCFPEASKTFIHDCMIINFFIKGTCQSEIAGAMTEAAVASAQRSQVLTQLPRTYQKKLVCT